MTLDDLYNPNNIKTIFVAYKNQTTGHWVEASADQKFQEMPGSWELWQLMDGRIMRVKRWLKKCVIASE